MAVTEMISQLYQTMKRRTSLKSRRWVLRAFQVIIAGIVAGSMPPARLLAAGEERFDSADAAAAALAAAGKAHDTNAIHQIFGPEGQELVSPDVVQANEGFNLFIKRLTEKTELKQVSDSKAVLEIGTEGWPFPIPIVKQNGKWFYDVDAGREEILNRRIGANELGAIDVSEAYVAAQREYASKDRKGDGVLEYAQHLRSTPGTHDGLYWPVKNPAEELSPFGPLIAGARQEGYHRRTGMMTENPAPYHGYYFKILTQQGKHAPAGKYNYIINGHMIAGFALVAWPAEWGNTGVMTFIVNQQGKVYHKNLGPNTEKVAKAMTMYDPDSTWTPAAGK